MYTYWKSPGMLESSFADPKPDAQIFGALLLMHRWTHQPPYHLPAPYPASNICMCICICICMKESMCVCMYLCTYIHTYIHTYLLTYLLTYIHTYIQYNTIQYNTIQYNTIQYNTIQYIHTYMHMCSVLYFKLSICVYANVYLLLTYMHFAKPSL